MCGSKRIHLQNQCFLKPIHDSDHTMSNENRSHMIPSPYVLSNPQLTTSVIILTIIELQPMVPPLCNFTLIGPMVDVFLAITNISEQVFFETSERLLLDCLSFQYFLLPAPKYENHS